MKRLAIKIGIFLAINAACAFLVLAVADRRLHFNQWETDSILISTPRETAFDYVILGTSRARLLNRVKANHDVMERELGRTMNLALGFGGGIVPEKIFLQNFFREKNTTKTIVYFLDAFTLYSDEPNRMHRLVYYEPFRPWFLTQLVLNDFPFERIFIYIQSKFTRRWFTQVPAGARGDKARVKTPIDPELAKKRVESMYFDGLNEDYFKKYMGTLREIFELARDNKCRLVLAFPPTLLGSQPGEYQVLAQLANLRKEFTFEFHDFTEKIKNPEFYSDYDHLNAKGVEVFVQDYLKPALAGQR